MTRSPDRLLAVGGLAVFLAVLVAVIGWTATASPRGSPDAHFELASTQGGAVDQTIFKGRPSLVYFGYTHCAEVCPTTLFDLAHWLDELGPDGRDLQALFFTIDPTRDTMDVMQPYVAAFSDRLVGITGAAGEMRKVTDGWLVTAEQRGTGENYSMRHTTSILLVGQNGRLAGLIPYDTPPVEAVAKIRDVLLRPGA